jgi:acetyl esterase/lipase
MDKENVVYIHGGVLLSHKEECNYFVFRKLDETGNIVLREISQT